MMARRKRSLKGVKYTTEADLLIEAARTGHWGEGTPLSDREIIRNLTSACFTENEIYEVARKYAPAMGWGIEEFVEQARKIGRSG